MTNLQTFDNLYASLSQSAYEDRPNSFFDAIGENDFEEMNYSLTKTEHGDTIFGGQNLPNNGVLYIHKDTTVHKEKVKFGPDEEYAYEKGLLKDEGAGFQAYFLTDTPQLSTSTENAYIAVKGSDGFSLNSLNDWIGNNAPFALSDVYTSQGKLVEKALHVKLTEMREKAPNAKLNGTGHSLGSIALVQGLANLSVEELEQIGEVKVFHGPDVLKSLRKMGVPEEKIKILNKKITYYVNPFDMVSMLNRDTTEQLGQIKVIVPINFKNTFDNPSSHDFGELQMNAYGDILEATEDFHPEFLRAGERLAKLLNKYRDDGIGKMISGYFSGEFQKEYDQIIAETRLETIKWSKEYIPKMQEQLAYATGSERITLRSRLLLSAGQLAMLETEDRIRGTKQRIEAYKNHVYGLIVQAHRQARMMAYYLNSHEVQALLSNFQLPNFWDDSLENMSVKQLDEYKVKIDQFSTTLFKAVEQLKEIDTSSGQTFESVLGGVQERWGK